jgi:hypothetical protein
MSTIYNLFSIGYRCNTDNFLKQMNLRQYSSPFSYVVIDIKTALFFINNKFQNFIKKEDLAPGKNTFTFNKKPWICNHIHKHSIITGDRVDILDMDTVCIWNHHDLHDTQTINSIHRRVTHLLECLDKSPNETLLFYIEKAHKYGEKDCYFDIGILDDYTCNFLILIPLLNFNKDPHLFYDNTKIRIIYFNSNSSGWGDDVEYNKETWSKLEILIKTLYTFDIKYRGD